MKRFLILILIGVRDFIVYPGFSILWFPFFLLALIIILPISRMRTLSKQEHGRAPRILWAAYALPQTGYMVRADRLFGYSSDMLIWYPSYYNNDWEISSFLRKIAPLCRAIVLPRYVGFLWSLLKYDIFQYYFDQHQLSDTILEFIELRLLKLAGKKVVLSLYGGDVLLPGIRGWNEVDNYEILLKDYPRLKSLAPKVRRQINIGIRHADFIMSIVPYSDVLPKFDVMRHYVCIDMDEWLPVAHKPAPGEILIAHSTNHRNIKGTSHVIAACNKLREEGYPVRLALLEKVPREEARRIYAKADIIVEQLLFGCLGMTAVEAMALEKPVVSFIRKDLYQLNPWMKECPVINANPETLYDRLLHLVQDPRSWKVLGEEGRRFVKQFYSLESIGSLNDRIYRHLWYKESPPLS